MEESEVSPSSKYSSNKTPVTNYEKKIGRLNVVWRDQNATTMDDLGTKFGEWVIMILQNWDCYAKKDSELKDEWT